MDGKPCDELECGPCVVLAAHRLVFEFQKRLIDADTYDGKREREKKGNNKNVHIYFSRQ